MRNPEGRLSPVTLLCLATLYSVWSSTYLATRVAVTSFAPWQMGSLRFLAAGAILYAMLRARGAPAPRLLEWRSSAVIGLLMMAVGLGGASMAMTRVSSGVAALVFGSVPIWTALFERMFGGRLRGREAAGMLVGLTGLAVVAARGQLRADPAGAAELGVAAAGYALGCALSRRLAQPPGSMSVAAQMLTAGVMLAVASAVRGEPLPAHVSTASVLALAHLVFLGSVVAYSALNHLLRTVRASLATSYAFVNPVIALGLGAVVSGEAVGRAELVAVVLVVTGVVIVASASWAPPAPRASRVEEDGLGVPASYRPT
jgi:drug/metabolite transporter (DMT)-like permease